MAEIIELDDVDALGTGAVGEPGKRAFYIQARTENAELTVLVEKEQIALLATEAVAFLDRIADDFPEVPIAVIPTAAVLQEPTVPLFRARLIGLGFDPERELVLIELRERPADDDDEDDGGGGPETFAAGGDAESLDVSDDEPGYVARIYATRAQVRAMAARGVDTVAGGRPPCPLCEQPMDPAGHACPRWNSTPAEVADRLRAAELEVVGRMRYSSNATFLVEARTDDATMHAIYKPRRGERPLWDFPEGSLCHREVAAYELSAARSGGVWCR